MEYVLRRMCVEVGLRRYHKGLLDVGLKDLTDADIVFLLQDMPLITVRNFWPGIVLYNDFLDDGDFSVRAICEYFDRLLELPRCLDVAALFHIFWLGTGLEHVPDSLVDSVYRNLSGLASNVTTGAFSHDTLSSLENTLCVNNKVRTLTGLETVTVKNLISHAKKGGRWSDIYQLLTACILIALQGIQRKCVYQTTFKAPDIKTTDIPVNRLPLFLHLDATRGRQVRDRLGQNPHYSVVQTLMVRLWEEYELLKVSPGCLCPEYHHKWYDYLQKCLPPGGADKWDKVYYPKLRTFAGEAQTKQPVNRKIKPVPRKRS